MNMRRQFATAFMVMSLTGAFFLSPAAQAQFGAPAQSTPASFADLSEELLPSVVNISSTHKAIGPEDFPDMPHFPPGSPFEDFFEEFMEQRGEGGMPATPPASLGSGFILDADQGLIVTNNHVVKDADEVRVTLHDDTSLPAEIIARDDKIDLALLKVKTDKKLTAVKFGDSEKLRVGDWILAIGNPFGLGGTVTAGIVSAQQRDINAGPYDDFIQTDASINRGNSGGPMFNLDGEVIGINTAIFSPSGGSVGIGFAIPSALAKPVIDQLIKYGRTRRGWLGVRIQAVTDDIAESFGLKETQGALIASVTHTGPAEVAGIKPGDIVVKFNGKPIKEMRELPRLVAETDIDSEATIEFWRDGQMKTAKIKVGELEKAEDEGLIASSDAEEGTESPGGESTAIESVGLSLGGISAQDREAYNITDDVQGVMVTETVPGSEAAEKGLSVGDVVVEINQQPVSSPAAAKEIIAKAAQAGRNSVLLLVNREGDVRFVALRLKKEP
ncbi:MAG: DegQ family serine endoprotease [Micavibrio aeruginosavorus]|uniref:Probable periplasmic serine endoprotease DegP-like n=1 Tax=Micavibrio aeruginosavorus TaxID=349221 RepID=A0A7T5R3B5_9BACT|nr:MAG: DegQ family serine endoprotease [Micavibrio aeruginosavorus]